MLFSDAGIEKLNALKTLILRIISANMINTTPANNKIKMVFCSLMTFTG